MIDTHRNKNHQHSHGAHVMSLLLCKLIAFSIANFFFYLTFVLGRKMKKKKNVFGQCDTNQKMFNQLPYHFFRSPLQ